MPAETVTVWTCAGVSAPRWRSGPPHPVAVVPMGVFHWEVAEPNDHLPTGSEIPKVHCWPTERDALNAWLVYLSQERRLLELRIGQIGPQESAAQARLRELIPTPCGPAAPSARTG